MLLHQLPSRRQRTRRRVGRGGKKGTYSGRGQKGQKSRAGHRLAPMVREILKHYPKQKGYRIGGAKPPPRTLSLKALEKNFQEGEAVTPETLSAKRVVRRVKGKVPAVKIVAGGKLSKPLKIEGCKVSASAKEQILNAGGSIA